VFEACKFCNIEREVNITSSMHMKGG
jgi:hypothetical protein